MSLNIDASGAPAAIVAGGASVTGGPSTSAATVARRCRRFVNLAMKGLEESVLRRELVCEPCWLLLDDKALRLKGSAVPTLERAQCRTATPHDDRDWRPLVRKAAVRRRGGCRWRVEMAVGGAAVPTERVGSRQLVTTGERFQLGLEPRRQRQTVSVVHRLEQRRYGAAA